MSLLKRVVTTTLAVALTVPFGARTADEKPAEQTQKTAPAAKKATRHSHSEMNKQGTPSPAPDQPAPPKKQGHKHSDWK